MVTRGGKDAAQDRQAGLVQGSPRSSRARPSWTRIPRLLSPVPPSPLPRGLTVQLYFTQSSQKCEAENFLRMTMVMPCSKHCPIPTMFPAERQPGKPSVPTQLPPRQGKAHATCWLTAGGRSSGQKVTLDTGEEAGGSTTTTPGAALCAQLSYILATEVGTASASS